jgi:hypothetical protein
MIDRSTAAKNAEKTFKLPPVFVGRPSSPTVSGRSSAKVAGLAFIGILLFGIGFFVWQVFSFWLGVFIGLAGGGVLTNCLEETNKRAATCPSCATRVWWVAKKTAFPCPACKRTLMEQGDNVYDITGGGA